MHVDAPHDRISDGGDGPGGVGRRPAGPHEAAASTVSAQELLTRALGLLRGPGSATGRTVLGLAGPPAAGKSAVARHLVDGIVASEGPGAAAYLPLDGFHLSNTQLDRLGLRARKGAPETFDTAGYLALLGRVANERFHDIYAPDFDRALDEPVAARHVIAPHTRLVVTEGNYLASADAPWSAVRGLLRELWYIDAEDDVRRGRLVERHTRNGQDREAAHLRIVANDHPNGEYVKAGRAGCHWIVRVSGLPLSPEGA